jgi:hypothetical protein
MMRHLAADYFVAVEGGKSGWSWRINRTSRPLGVTIVGGPLKTERAARLAGEKALRDLLERLIEETERQ